MGCGGGGVVQDQVEPGLTLFLRIRCSWSVPKGSQKANRVFLLSGFRSYLATTTRPRSWGSEVRGHKCTHPSILLSCDLEQLSRAHDQHTQVSLCVTLTLCCPTWLFPDTRLAPPPP